MGMEIGPMRPIRPLRRYSETPAPGRDEWWAAYLTEEVNHGPRVYGKGTPVWALIWFYQGLEENREKTLTAYNQVSAEEFDAALAYYRRFPFVIDQQLKALATW